MIDPATIGDWMQALTMATLIVGAGAALWRTLRLEEAALVLEPVESDHPQEVRDPAAA